MRSLAITDKHSLSLKNIFSFDIIEKVKISKYIDEAEFEEMYKLNLKSIENLTKADLIFYGSNKYHHFSLFLIKYLKPKRYLLIDQHPDDFELKKNINSGSFIKYIKTLGLSNEIYYIGFLEPENKNDFDEYILIEKNRKNWEEILEFVNKISSKIYVSIDLDIIKYKDFPSLYNKYEFLLSLNEFFEIIKRLKNKARKMDICGFCQTQKVEKVKSFIKTLNNIIA